MAKKKKAGGPQRICPKCNMKVHARKAECPKCNHKFTKKKVAVKKNTARAREKTFPVSSVLAAQRFIKEAGGAAAARSLVDAVGKELD